MLHAKIREIEARKLSPLVLGAHRLMICFSLIAVLYYLELLSLDDVLGSNLVSLSALVMNM